MLRRCYRLVQASGIDAIETSLGGAATLIVHDHRRTACLGGDARHAVVAAETRDVVDQVGAGEQAPPGDCGL